MAGWVVDQSVVDQIASITAEDTEAARQIYVKALRVGLSFIILHKITCLD